MIIQFEMKDMRPEIIGEDFFCLHRRQDLGFGFIHVRARHQGFQVTCSGAGGSQDLPAQHLFLPALTYNLVPQ